MNSQSIFRLGGLAAIAGLLLSVGGYVSMVMFALGALLVAVYVFALYHLFRHAAPAPSLAAAGVGIGGAVFLAGAVVATGSQSGTVVGIASWAAYFLPPLAFGFLAYQHPAAGLPRPLAVIGLLGGAFGLVNTVLVLAGGGDYAAPNNPALTPFIMGTYYLAMLPVLIWMVWTGIALLRAGPTPQRQPA
jgi:hypothetical protein